MTDSLAGLRLFRTTILIFAGSALNMTYKDLEMLVVNSITALYGHQEARSVQRFLFTCLLDSDPVDYLLKRDQQADATFERRIKAAIPQLMDFKPVQYITGKTWFCGIPLTVRPGVLIPRPETEGLVMMIADKYKGQRNMRILDIGTGSGAIAIGLGLQLNDAKVEAIDNSTTALEVAKENAAANKADILFSLVDILDRKACHHLSSYSVIVSNPPYVKRSEIHLMRRNVLDYEPASALFVDDRDPLVYYRAIADFSLSHLDQGGELWFEINEAEGLNLKRLLLTLGFSSIEVHSDLNSRPRYVSAKL